MKSTNELDLPHTGNTFLGTWQFCSRIAHWNDIAQFSVLCDMEFNTNSKEQEAKDLR